MSYEQLVQSFERDKMRAPAPVHSWYRGQTLIYVEHNDVHYVYEGHYDEYLLARKSVPAVLKLFTQAREMREALNKEGVWL